jgi:hypothetical protein
LDQWLFLTCALLGPPIEQYLEKELEAGGLMDQYEVEGPDRTELLMDLSEFQMAAVRPLNAPFHPLPATCFPLAAISYQLSPTPMQQRMSG